jgi:benzodiazapine receptor
MKTKEKHHYGLLFFLTTFLLIAGSITSFLVKKNIKTWYNFLYLSRFNPPNITFGIVWTILYILLGIAGWLIWRNKGFPKLFFIKVLYTIQIALNLSWSMLFFQLHLTGISFASIIIMIIATALMMFFSYKKINYLTLLLTPYILWLGFAGYLNFYVFMCN